MKNLILAFILAFSVSANAGFKVNTGLESREVIQMSTDTCNKQYVGGVLVSQECNSYVDKKRVQTLRASIGYDHMMNEKYGVEMLAGIDTLTNAQAEVNGLLKINEKVTTKAGLNLSKDLNNKLVKSMEQGTGFQVGANYNLKSNMDLFATVGTKSQSYTLENLGSTKDSTVFANVGISFRF